MEIKNLSYPRFGFIARPRIYIRNTILPKSLIVYYSLHGSTKRIALAIADGLKGSGFQVTLHNIVDGLPPDPSKFDLLGIGSPVYYYKLPINISEYLKSLPNLDGLPVFSFMLYGTYHFNAPDILQKTLKRKHASLIGQFQSKGADIYLGYLQQSYLFSPNHPVQGEVLAAVKFGKEMGQSRTGIIKQKENRKSQFGMIYKLERFLANKWFINNIYRHAFKVAKEKCTSCGECQIHCPVNNIHMDHSVQPIWGKHCILCLNCQLKCPDQAIKSYVDWFLTKRLIAYNISQASSDISIKHVKIEHDFPNCVKD